MAIKNYTSTVPMINSIARIEHRLAQAGATDISKSYDGGKPTGMIFRIMVNNQPVTFKLPAKVDRVLNHLVMLRKKPPTKSQLESLQAQADRTAWKILNDWIDIQVSMIELEQAEPMEIFLPYLYDGRSKQTLFERAKENQFKQLTEGTK